MNITEAIEILELTLKVGSGNLSMENKPEPYKIAAAKGMCIAYLKNIYKGILPYPIEILDGLDIDVNFEGGRLVIKKKKEKVFNLICNECEGSGWLSRFIQPCTACNGKGYL